MFLLDTSAVPYTDPWESPLTERLAMLSRGKYRVAYFYETANNSTFRYRAYNMVQALNSEEDASVSASYFFLEDLLQVDKIADLADLLVICRSMYNHSVNQLVTKFRIRNKKVLFDIDDLVFDTRYAHLIIQTLDQDINNPTVWHDWFSWIARWGETLRLCDAAITTNDYLAARVAEFSHKPVSVVPNFINREQLDLAQRMFRGKEKNRFARDGKITLGYFSGSPSHNLDYAIITSALEEVLERDPRTEVMVVGYIEAGPSLALFGERIKYYPFQDYVNLLRLIGSVEFNLIPLQNNVFTNCKSELKYFDAAIVGTISIASPSHTYSAAIQDGVNGYLSSAHQWTSVISRAIENMEDYPQIATAAYEHALSKYSWLHQRNTIIQALEIN